MEFYSNENGGSSPFDCAANVMAILENSKTQLDKNPQIEKLYGDIASGKLSSTIYQDMEIGKKLDYHFLITEIVWFDTDESFHLEFLRELEILIKEKEQIKGEDQSELEKNREKLEKLFNNKERKGVSPFDCAANVIAILENSKTQTEESLQIERLYREITGGKFSSIIYENMENGDEKRAYLALLKKSTRLEKDEEFCLEFLEELERLIIRNNLEKLLKL